MGYLLDTHTLIWMMENDSRLPASVGAILTDESEELRVSPVSFWEISIKRSLGKLVLKHSTVHYWQEAIAQRIFLLPLDIAHLQRLEQLPFHHRDPFDRLLIAQAQQANLTLLTRDEQFAAYEVMTIWNT